MILRRVIAHFRRQEWTAIALDFQIVVVGILIAFQITEWNEARRERALERDYLERIVAELDQSIEAMEDSIVTARGREELGQFLMQSVDEPDIVRADPGRFIFAVLTGGYTYSPDVRAHTFEEIKSTGDLGIFRDKALLVDLTEFYTRVQGAAQWDYLRELKQTEYVKRSAGILTYDLLKQTPYAEGPPDIAVEDAMAAHARMLDHPSFIEWLPTVTDRYDDIRAYQRRLDAAQRLRARILTALGDGERQPHKELAQ
jgi:hypothetical protein